MHTLTTQEREAVISVLPRALGYVGAMDPEDVVEFTPYITTLLQYIPETRDVDVSAWIVACTAYGFAILVRHYGTLEVNGRMWTMKDADPMNDTQVASA